MAINGGFDDLVNMRAPILAEGSVFERLRRSNKVQFDEQLAHASLVFDATGSCVLEAIHREYCEVAIRHRLPLVMFTDTWRANSDRIARSAFADQDVNEVNAQFLCDIRDSFGPGIQSIFVAGLIGCRGDAYRPEEALSTDEAIEFHREQVMDLCGPPIDLLFAATLPALSEARGIAVVMRETGTPYVLSFVITPDGTLLDGTPIDQAVTEIDATVTLPPVGYYINCVHPSIVLKALESPNAKTLRDRFIGFQANTSALSPKELDGIEQLQTAPPESFAEAVFRVGRECRMSVLGGCCGTDTRHIECIAKLMVGAERTKRTKKT